MRDSLAIVETIFERHGLDNGLSEAAKAQTKGLLDNPGIDDDRLEDLTGLPFVTIDNEHSRDLDQALFIARSDTGYAVYYALADAAYYIRPGTPLFQRALERGASFYVADRAAPMLPRELSEGLVSLNPNVDRRALVFKIDLDNTGQTQSTSVFPGRIQSRAKLSYGGVERWLKSPHRNSQTTEEYHESLKYLQEVGELLIAQALRRNVVQFDRAEAQIYTTPGGDFRVTLRDRYDVERYNEQLSLLCNTEGARILRETGYFLADELQSVFRVHDAPPEARVRQMRATIRDIVRAHNLPESLMWDGEQQLSDYVAGLPEDDAFRRVRQAIERQIQRSNTASMYSDQASPHYALAVESYARFSSPMREVVGIFTHKELLESIAVLESLPKAEDQALQQEVIKSGNRSRSLQKQLNKEVALEVIRQLAVDALALPAHERPRWPATIVGIQKSRMYVVLDAMPLEIKVYADDLGQRYSTTYEVSGAEFTAENGPDFRIGDAVNVIALEWDKGRKRAIFGLETLKPQP